MEVHKFKDKYVLVATLTIMRSTEAAGLGGGLRVVGVIRSRGSHDKRSSGTSFALEWKHENVKLVCIIAGTIAVFFMFLVLLYGTTFKKISIQADGRELSVTTNHQKWSQLLQEQLITVGEHDRVSQALDSQIENGETLVIERAVPVQLTVEGQTQTVYTLGETVEHVIKDAKVVLDEDDLITPALTAKVDASTEITVVRVDRMVSDIEETIPYQVIERKDPALLKGKEQIVQSGRSGVKVKTIEKVYENGQLVSESIIGETIRRDSMDKIVAIGTKNPVTILSASSPNIAEVTKDGVTFGIKQTLNNVKLTAYTAHFASTKKTPDHPHFGITYTGTRVKEGRTVAVDPKVIPLGWWIYIEGIGFRKAEDIGSGVRGKHVDVYFEDEDFANKFGLKRGYTVHIIGPTAPPMN
jgi:uncharacterized protein YabE (DUF348 family)/3D (Asp-Asp-Asp) domain-containing protein